MRPKRFVEPGSAGGNRAAGCGEFLRHSAAGSRAEHRTRAGGAPGVEGARIADQGRGISEESIAGFAAAVRAVRREFRVRGYVGKHNAADVHVRREGEFAAVHRRTDSPGSCARGPGTPKPGATEKS